MEALQNLDDHSQAPMTPRRERKGRTNRRQRDKGARAATQLEKVADGSEDNFMHEIKLMKDSADPTHNAYSNGNGMNDRSRSQKKEATSNIDLQEAHTSSRNALEAIKAKL